MILEGVRVVDRTTDIAGPYCTRLLADAGADVVKVEPEGGDPLRAWRSGALFEFLNASKRSVTRDDDLVVSADLLVTGTPVDTTALWAVNPALVVVTITAFGADGPWAGRPATEFTLQAWSASTGFRGLPDQPPLAAGGRLGEWITGVYAAVGALAARREADRTGAGEHVDVAMLDCMALTMATFPSVFADLAGRPAQQGTGRTIEVPSIEPSADGFVVFTTNSAQQFHDFLVLLERPDLLADEGMARVNTRFRRRDEFLGAVHAYTTTHTSEELLERASLLRIPAGPVLNGRTIPTFPQFVERGVFETAPSGRFTQPRVPYRILGDEPRALSQAPGKGADDGRVDWGPRPPRSTAPWELPLAGLRVIDCTAWWAGPSAPWALAALGADVIKVESVARPDLMRYAGVKRPPEEQWWEWGPLFHAVNLGKRGVTLDLTRPEGVAVLERLLSTADLLVENYTPRVMEQFGLGWSRVHQVNPRLIMVRMPAFGLDGPWRDNTGFAQTMESMSGMAWVTGAADGTPVLVRGACDPLAGMHAVFAILLALKQRDRTGEGTLVESVMVEAALNVAAEQVIEYQATGELLTRDGNRGPVAAPQGVYPCAGDDAWVAIAVTDDREWLALRSVLGDPGWADDPALAADAGRRRAHDRIDGELVSWCSSREASVIAEELARAGVPAAVVIPARDVNANPQLVHRGLFEVEDHPVTGRCPIPTMPFRYSRVDLWARRPSPTLGQHNAEVLGEVCDDLELDELRRAGIIGERIAGA